MPMIMDDRSLGSIFCVMVILRSIDTFIDRPKCMAGITRHACKSYSDTEALIIVFNKLTDSEYPGVIARLQ